MNIVIALDFINGIICLYEFNRRLKDVSKAVKQSAEMSPSTSGKTNDANGTRSLERTARDSTLAGGGAILVFLGSYLFTFIGISISKRDEMTLATGFVSNVSTVIMHFVIAYFTRSVWVVDGKSVLGRFYTVVHSERNTHSQELKTSPHLHAEPKMSAEGPLSASHPESV
jgi:hypothetical protein